MRTNPLELFGLLQPDEPREVPKITSRFLLSYSVNMFTEFLGNNIWSAIRAEAKRFDRKSFVAVAYFGTGAAKAPTESLSTLKRFLLAMNTTTTME